jgi:hypothetical protein
LARTVKNHRVLTSVEILDRKINTCGYMSLGSGYYKKPNNFSLVPERYKHMMPMYIDGNIIGSDLTQYSNLNKKISHAFINLVMETNFEYEVDADVWNVPFITEKSTKPFIWGQVPLFVCCHDSLKYLRELGLDLFDDIIDHSYDLEIDPYKRIKMTVDQLEKICSQPIEHWQKYKQDNISRFIKNSKLVAKLNLSMNKKVIQDLQKVIDK